MKKIQKKKKSSFVMVGNYKHQIHVRNYFIYNNKIRGKNI